MASPAYVSGAMGANNVPMNTEFTAQSTTSPFKSQPPTMFDLSKTPLKKKFQVVAKRNFELLNELTRKNFEMIQLLHAEEKERAAALQEVSSRNAAMRSQMQVEMDSLRSQNRLLEEENAQQRSLLSALEPKASKRLSDSEVSSLQAENERLKAENLKLRTQGAGSGAAVAYGGLSGPESRIAMTEEIHLLQQQVSNYESQLRQSSDALARAQGEVAGLDRALRTKAEETRELGDRLMEFQKKFDEDLLPIKRQLFLYAREAEMTLDDIEGQLEALRISYSDARANWDFKKKKSLAEDIQTLMVTVQTCIEKLEGIAPDVTDMEEEITKAGIQTPAAEHTPTVTTNTTSSTATASASATATTSNPGSTINSTPAGHLGPITHATRSAASAASVVASSPSSIPGRTPLLGDKHSRSSTRTGLPSESPQRQEEGAGRSSGLELSSKQKIESLLTRVIVGRDVDPDVLDELAEVTVSAVQAGESLGLSGHQQVVKKLVEVYHNLEAASTTLPAGNQSADAIADALLNCCHVYSVISATDLGKEVLLSCDAFPMIVDMLDTDDVDLLNYATLTVSQLVVSDRCRRVLNSLNASQLLEQLTDAHTPEIARCAAESLQALGFDPKRVESKVSHSAAPTPSATATISGPAQDHQAVGDVAVRVLGERVEGSTLEATCEPSLADVSYFWQREQDGVWLVIGSGPSYHVALDDVDHRLRVRCEVDASHTYFSDPTIPIPPGDPHIDRISFRHTHDDDFYWRRLVVEWEYRGGHPGKHAFSWYRTTEQGENKTLLDGVKEDSYQPTWDDIGHIIIVEVIPYRSDGTRGIMAIAQSPVLQSDPDMIKNFKNVVAQKKGVFKVQAEIGDRMADALAVVKQSPPTLTLQEPISAVWSAELPLDSLQASYVLSHRFRLSVIMHGVACDTNGPLGIISGNFSLLSRSSRSRDVLVHAIRVFSKASGQPQSIPAESPSSTMASGVSMPAVGASGGSGVSGASGRSGGSGKGEPSPASSPHGRVWGDHTDPQASPTGLSMASAAVTATAARKFFHRK